jgi:hypothetical protein
VAKSKSLTSPPSRESYDEWSVKEALSTLCRAKEIHKDPKMMKLVSELAKKKMTEMAKIVGEDECEE